jgi:hypothetical protein
MKRLLAVCLLMLCLSFPVFAGHNVPGGYACECGTAGCLEDFPGECNGYQPMSKHQTEVPKDDAAALGILIVALMFWLRLKA